MIPFVSVDDLSDYLGQDLSGSDLAVIAVNAACQSIRTFLNRPLNLITETVTLDGSGTDALLLNAPVVSVDTVTEDDVELDETTDYIVGDDVLYRVGWCWPRGRRNIEVTYTHGYAVDESDVGADSGDVGSPGRMPDDIRQVALELADSIYNASTTVQGSGATTGYTVGPESYSEQFDVGTTTNRTVAGNLSAGQRDRLRPYRFRAVA